MNLLQSPLSEALAPVDAEPLNRQCYDLKSVNLLGYRPGYFLGIGWKIAKAAPCGSSRMAKRPTFSIVKGSRQNLAPISLALAAVESQSAT